MTSAHAGNYNANKLITLLNFSFLSLNSCLGDLEAGQRPAVVGPLEADDLLGAGVAERDGQGQVVGLRRRVDGEDGRQLRREHPAQPLRHLGHRAARHGGEIEQKIILLSCLACQVTWYVWTL